MLCTSFLKLVGTDKAAPHLECHLSHETRCERSQRLSTYHISNVTTLDSTSLRVRLSMISNIKQMGCRCMSAAQCSEIVKK